MHRLHGGDGMKTLEEIKGRCFITEDGHWLWRGALRPDGRANIYAPNYTSGKMEVQAGPRAVWHCHTEEPIPPGWRAFGTCEEKACCNPEHTNCTSNADFGAYLSRDGALKGQTNRILANRAINRKRAKLTPEVIAHIQASTLTGLALARELKLSPASVSKARRGQTVVYQAGGGFFLGLVASVTQGVRV